VNFWESLLVTTIGGVLAAIIFAFGKYFWAKSRTIKSLILYFISQGVGLSLVFLNDLYLWSFGFVILGVILMMVMPVYDFLRERKAPVTRIEILVNIVLPLLVCIFISAAYVPSYVIRTSQKANRNLQTSIGTQTKVAK